MSSVLPKLQPIIKAGVSERTLQVEVELPERKERFRAVSSIGTKEVLEYLVATKTPHGKLISGPGGVLNNRAGSATAVWVFEKIDLRVSSKQTNRAKQSKQNKTTKSS